MSRGAAGWALAALFGIVLAAGIGWATSSLTGQHIGLSSEPLSAVRRLAPATAAAPRPGSSARHSGGPATTVRTVTVPAPLPGSGTQTETASGPPRASEPPPASEAVAGAPGGERPRHDDGGEGAPSGAGGRRDD